MKVTVVSRAMVRDDGAPPSQALVGLEQGHVEFRRVEGAVDG